MPKSHIYAVIPTFNRRKYTEKCLKSFEKQTYKNFTVILVDSGSTDGTREYFKKKYPKWHLINGSGDWWWTKATHEGIKWAMKSAKQRDFILLMNNDCYFDKGYLSQLIKTAKHHPKALLGSICVRHNKPTEVVEVGIRIYWPHGLVYAVSNAISNRLSYYKYMEVVGDLDALPGKGTLIPVKVFKKIGHFDYKLLPHYIADYEFSNRAKRAGFELLVDTHAVVKHYWEATGISSENEKIYSYSRALQILFGRKSMNNIIDWVIFLFKACPPKYLPINLFIAFQKVATAAFSVYPLYYFRPIPRAMLRIYFSTVYFVKMFYSLFR